MMNKDSSAVPLSLSSFCRPFVCPPSARILFLRTLLFAVVVVTGPAGSIHLPAADPQPPPPSIVLATVDGISITSRDVQRELDRVVQSRDVPPAALPPLSDAALRQLINRWLVAAYLKENGFAARPQEVERALQRARQRLEQQQLTLDQYLQQSGLTVDAFRDQAAWQIAWPQFLERHVTDENLERYFEKHRRDFDGTEVSVAHILLRIDPPDEPRSRDATIAAAQQLREWIQGGELSFARAAQQYSIAPTAAEAGRLGFIGRRQPMPEAFTEAAFALEPGTISPPVVTASGVHLIQCLEVKPGTQRWQDVRADLELAVTRHLFRWAADRQRPHAKIEIRRATRCLPDSADTCEQRL